VGQNIVCNEVFLLPDESSCSAHATRQDGAAGETPDRNTAAYDIL